MATMRGAGRNGPRRKLIWARQPSVSVPLAAGGIFTLDLLANFETAYGAQLIGCTVMRVRGTLQTFGTAPDLLNPVIVGTIVTAATVTPLGPFADPHADWMQFDSVYFTHGAVSAGEPIAGNMTFDVKSRRKLDELGQRCLMQFSNTGVGGVSADVSTSVLLMLP